MARRTQTERSQATTSGLIEAALLLFGRDGYAATSIDDVARVAGMTKGAIYHHFSGKIELFRAVFVRQEQQLAEAIAMASVEARDPVDVVRRGAHTFLRRCVDPQVRRIILLDGPAVLGWDTIRAIEYEYTLKLVRDGLAAAAAEGRIPPGDVTVRAHLVFGALCEAGMLMARVEDPAGFLPAVLDQADELLDALTLTTASRSA